MVIKTMLLTSFLCLFLSHILILEAYCDTTSPKPTGITTTEPIDKMVEKELGLYSSWLDKLDTEDSREKFKLKGMILGQVRALIQQKYRSERLMDKRIEVIGGLRNEMKNVNKTLQSLACAKEFRYAMDVFGMVFGHRIGEKLQSSPALTTALNNIKNVLKRRSSIIENCADMLATLYQEYFDNAFCFDSPSQQLSAWQGKAKFAYRTLRTINITVNRHKELPKYPDVADLVMQIYSASDEKSAVMVFQKQCESHYWGTIKYMHHQDYTELKKLATHLPEDEKTDLIDNFNSNNKANLESKDLLFLYVLLECSTFYVKNNERYEGCVEVFCYAPSQSIELLKDDLKKKWPNLDYPFRVDRFCDAFATLYDMLRGTGIHAVPHNGIITCDVDSMYIYNFIRKLIGSKYRIDDFIVVGQVLGKISFDFIPPTTPMMSKYAEYKFTL